MPKGTSTYATVQSDGSVLFDFPGHVSAQGIDLLAGLSSTPPNDRKIRWHQDPSFSGAVIAEIYANTFPINFAQGVSRVFSPDGVASAGVLTSAAPPGVATSGVDVFANDGTNGNQQITVVGGLGGSMLMQDGRSRFPAGLVRNLKWWDIPGLAGSVLAPGTDQVATITHGLNFPAGTGQFILGFCTDGLNSQRITWGTRNVLANSFDLVLFNASPAASGVNASAIWIGCIITVK